MSLALWLENLWQDVRHGVRLFANAPGFTAIAILSIACGTGANVAMFSVADALLLRPLPAPRPEELLVVGARVDQGRRTATVASYPDYVDVRDRNRNFSGLFTYTIRRNAIGFRPDAPTQVKLLQLVSGNFFDVLGVAPALGRGFTADEDRVPGRNAVAVLSHGVWQQQFGGDPAAVGASIRIAGIPFTIVGVLPEEFSGLEIRSLPEMVYVPLAMAPVLGDTAIEKLLSARDLRILTVRGRLKPDADIASARADLETIGRNLQRAYPATNTNIELIAQTELESRVTTAYINAALVLLLSILSTAVLGVACANVAGLLCSRAVLRAKEISLRLAVGASRTRLVRQLITESVMLALAGGVCGLAVGYAGIALIQQIEFPSEIGARVVALDRRALAFSLAVAMGSAFLFGIGPALHTTRLDLAGAIKTGEGAPHRRRPQVRSGLVAIQVALSLVIVTVAAVAFQVFHRIVTEGPGFRVTQLATVTVDTPRQRYDASQAAALFERAAAATRNIPGVISATVTSVVPFWGLQETVLIQPDGFRLPEGDAGVRPLAVSIGEDYFDTMDIAIVRGRPFHETDTAAATRVAIVNETLARRYWPTRDAVGARFRLGGEDGPWIEVVGVARDSKYFYIVEPPQEAVYFPYRQEPRGSMILLARTSGPSLAAVGPLREIVRSLDADLPVYEAQTMETFYAARATGFLKVASELIGALGLMGMALTMVGLYALVSCSVSRRTREIGIRMAIGATYTHIVRMILRQGLGPAWLGLPVGLALSVITTRALPSIIPSVERNNPWLFLTVIPVLLCVMLMAAFVPARRAARVDPMVALRYE